MAARFDVADYPVVTYSRDEFVHEVWDYKPGDHVTILGATENGKTHLAFQLIDVTATPELQAIVIVMKPKDTTVSRFTKRLGFKIIRDWPPSTLTRFQKKPRGYVLWPKESDDPEYDDRRHSMIFRRALRDCYKRGGNFVFADEAYSLQNEYHLSADLIRTWTKGRSMGSGLWAATQRPAWIGNWAYQAQHLFLSYDPDKNNQKRYGEIGAGIDTALVQELTAQLEQFQWVYINRNDRTLCIVDK